MVYSTFRPGFARVPPDYYFFIINWSNKKKEVGDRGVPVNARKLIVKDLPVGGASAVAQQARQHPLLMARIRSVRGAARRITAGS